MVQPVDEGRHRPDGTPAWSEAWHFLAASPDRRAGVAVSLVLRPALRTAWYVAVFVRAAAPLVQVVDVEVPLPARRLEIRSHGLWADHVCETALDHWTVASEATAVAFDDPAEAVRSQRGDLVGLALDLEWEAAGTAEHGHDGYGVPAEVHGEVLLGSDEHPDRFEVVAWPGRWLHRWGSGAGVLSGGTPPGGDALLAPAMLPSGAWWRWVDRTGWAGPGTVL